MYVSKSSKKSGALLEIFGAMLVWLVHNFVGDTKESECKLMVTPSANQL